MLARQGFVYDTEPISRAFVSGKHLAPRVDQLHLFRVLQQAFYVEGLDTTSLSVLCGVLQRALAAQGFDHPDDAIRRVMDSREITHATRAEFAQVRSWGLRSFPQFLIQDGERVEVLHSGFAQAEVIAERMALAERIGQTACPALRSVAT